MYQLLPNIRYDFNISKLFYTFFKNIFTRFMNLKLHNNF